MVHQRRREEWPRRGRGNPAREAGEPEEERALRELQQQAGNRAVTGALESMHDPDAPTAPASQVDSPGLRLLSALRSAPVHVQRQASGGLVRRGMRGPEVEALQADLGRAGYALAVDGIFGPVTQAAVVTFQRRAGLAADGIVGPATRGALASGGKAAGKGSVEKEAWVPTEGEAADKEAALKKVAPEEATTKGDSVEKEAWAPDEEAVAGKESAVKESAVEEIAATEPGAKEPSSIEKEAWAPTDDDAAVKEQAAKESGAKDAGSTEKDDWWLT